MTRFSEIPTGDSGDGRALVERRIVDCEAALGIGLTIHDHTGFFRDAADQPLLMRRNVHWHPYCQQERRSTVQHCNRHCNGRVHEEADRRRCPFVASCWKGVREIIVPVLHERIHVATLYAGAWRGQPSRRELNDAPRQPALCTAHRKLPDLDPARAESIAGQLQVWAEGLTSLISALRFAEASDDRAGQIRRCVARGAHRKFGLTDLAAELHLSPSRASHVVRECCGMSFQELLLRERIGRARVLLQASPHRLSAIAERCGFSDAAQFSRLFKREVGMSPGAWRRRHATRAAMV